MVESSVSGREMQSHPLPTPVLIVTLLFSAIAGVLYLLALQETLEKCSPASRTMKPWKVWLVLIPLFGFAWHFAVVVALADSLANEFASRGIPGTEPAPGRTVGLAASACNICMFIPLLYRIAAIIGFVLWIAYWVKIARYSRVLDANRATDQALPTP
jgi:hypothetical protein